MIDMLTSITISVRRLVEFLLRSGSIDNRTGGGDEETMQEGSRMHRTLQKAQPEGYRAEVPLKLAWTFEKKLETAGGQTEERLVHRPPLDEASVVVEGRADGIYYGSRPEESDRKRKKRRKAGEPQGQAHGSFWTVDEIKTTYRRLSRMRHPEPVHLAQAKCYAYIYAAQHDLDRINVRMTYCNLYSGEIRYFYEEETLDELTAWFSALMEEYRKWAEYMLLWQIRRTASIRQLQFPFPYRKGQRELVAGVYRTILRGRKLFLEAPTGTGKTLATLYPSLKAMGEGRADKIFYLTAKTITRTAAADTLDLLRSGGLLCKSVGLTAREKICVLDHPACNPEECPRARGHYDRINEALFAMLTQEDSFDRRTLERYAAQYQVCPYALSLDISQFSDVIIGDYNYLFDPHAWLHRLFPEGEGRKPYVFLIDEAHNLLDRGRTMYSAALVKEDVLTFRKKIIDLYPDLAGRLSKVNRGILEIRRREKAEAAKGNGDRPVENGADGTAGQDDEWKNCQILDEIDKLMQSTAEAQTEMESILGEERIAQQNGHARQDPLYREKKAVHEEFLDFYFMLAHFNLICTLRDEHYVTYAGRQEETGHYQVRLLCADPSVNLRRCMERGQASILFSATFLPIQYYKSLLGGTREDYEIYAHSVFDREKQGLFIVRDVTSRYRQRSLQQYERIAACIHNLTGERHGNYLIFCPSFAFMNNVADCYEDRYLGGRHTELMVRPTNADQNGQENKQQTDFTQWQPFEDGRETQLTLQGTFGNAILPGDHTVPATEIAVIRQGAHMGEEERERFLQLFQTSHNDQSLLGFCVLGGIFGEGIDLRKDALIGAVIVGTGVPMVGTERELLRHYFSGKGKNGYAYAYTYPGMNKVLQAAGRVIRTQEDVGFVALLDDRFTTPQYRALFPAEWTNAVETNSTECSTLVEKFWNEWL